MDAKEINLARFFAKLASIPTPAERMTPGQVVRFENQLERDFERERKGKPLLGPEFRRAERRRCARESGLDALPARERSSLEAEFLASSSFVQETFRTIEERQRTKSGKAEYKREWAKMAVDVYLPMLHKKVRESLLRLFDDQAVSLLDLYEHDGGDLEPLTKIRLHGGHLREYIAGTAPHEHPAGDFVSLLRSKPFPFRQCPICSRFFFRVRRQRYCSPRCTSRGVEAARKGKRREYMRRLMARRRSLGRAKRRSIATAGGK